MSKILKTEQEVMQALCEGCVLVDEDGDKFKIRKGILYAKYHDDEDGWIKSGMNSDDIIYYNPKILKPKKKKEKTWFYSAVINNGSLRMAGSINGIDFISAYNHAVQQMEEEGCKKECILFTAFNRV